MSGRMDCSAREEEAALAGGIVTVRDGEMARQLSQIGLVNVVASERC